MVDVAKRQLNLLDINDASGTQRVTAHQLTKTGDVLRRYLTPAKQTLLVAQHLNFNLDIPGHGTVSGDSMRDEGNEIINEIAQVLVRTCVSTALAFKIFEIC